jgi:hypothetical protein
MSRTFQDPDFLLWEVFASAGDSGYPDHARIVFNCLTDLQRPPRAVRRATDKTRAEEEVISLSDEQLGELLRTAQDLD